MESDARTKLNMNYYLSAQFSKNLEYLQETNSSPCFSKLQYTIPKFPYRVTGCGFQTGLTILLDPLQEDYFGSFFDSVGFELLIHDAYDYPDDNAGFKMLSYGRETFLRIFPEKTYASEDIQNLDASQRSCRFSREVKLKGMQRYSYINCMAECRSKLVFERCGCIPLTTANPDSYPFCNHFDQILCINESRGKFSSIFKENYFRRLLFQIFLWERCRGLMNRSSMSTELTKYQKIFVAALRIATLINMNQK